MSQMTPPRWLAIILPNWLKALLWWIACGLGSFVAACLLGGCATEQYWFRDAPGVPHRRTVIVRTLPPACLALNAWACADRATGTIYMLDSVPADWRDCVIAHERTHLDGWNHSDRGTLGGAMCGLNEWREMR